MHRPIDGTLFGQSVAAGDVDGYGYDDVFFGATSDTPGRGGAQGIGSSPVTRLGDPVLTSFGASLGGLNP